MSKHPQEPEGEKFALGSLDEQSHWRQVYHDIVGEMRQEIHRGDAEDHDNDDKLDERKSIANIFIFVLSHVLHK